MLKNSVTKKIFSLVLCFAFLLSFILANDNLNYATNNDKTYGEYEIGTVISSDEKMKWVAVDVDSKNSNKYFLVTKDIVDIREFNEGLTNYKNSKIRFYLNGEFFEKNFSSEEKKHIIETEINSVIIDSSGNKEIIKTTDKIFLLSSEEVDKYGIVEMNPTTNKYAKRLFDVSMDRRFWTRDVDKKLDEAYVFDKKYKDLKSVDTPFGILIGMWYDFSNVDNNIGESDNYLIERQGGKKSNIKYDKEEIQHAAIFENNSLTFNKMTLGQYEHDNKNKNLKWLIVDEDETDYILFCDNIIEYMELEYDSYDNDIIKNNAYNHSNIKKYLNSDFVDKIFSDSNKELLSKFPNGDYLKLPSLDDLYRYGFLKEVTDDKKDINTDTRSIMSIKKDSSYFIDGEYEENGITYLLSVILLNKKVNSKAIDFLRSNYVTNNANRKKPQITYTMTCSGLRPMIKINKKKCKEQKIGVITTYNSTIIKDKDLKFKDKIKFGKYEQDGDLTNGKEDIVWSVITKDYNNILLISDKILDVIDLDDELSVENYYDSTLRSFANSDFLNSAFDDKERELLKIVSTSSTKFKGDEITKNTISDSYGTDSGYDKVLSLYAMQNFENRNLMYEDLLKTNETQYVKNKYGEVGSYLKQDIYSYKISNEKKGTGIPHYFQINNDGTYELNKKSKGGFRPLICLKWDDAIKFKIDN